MKVVVSPEAKRRFRESLAIYRTYMTRREAARRTAEVKAMLRYLVKHPGHGAFEDLLQVPEDGIRYRRAIAGHFKIVYRVVDRVVQVSDIFGARQDPEKMKG